MPCRIVMSLLLLPGFVSADEFQPLSGKESRWNGFARVDFEVDGRRCWVVQPKHAAMGRPWVWRARFFGHEPQAQGPSKYILVISQRAGMGKEPFGFWIIGVSWDVSQNTL